MTAPSTAATNQDITMFAGDEIVLRVPILDPEGNPIPLPGARGYWFLEKGGAVVLSKDPNSGVSFSVDEGVYVMLIAFDRADTEDRAPGLYTHRVRLVQGDGRLSTVSIGRFNINASPGRPSPA